MGYKNREVEVKMLAVGVKGLQTMVDRVEKALKTDQTDIIIGNAADLYWKAAQGPADFVRLRRVSNASNQGQITAKATDKGSNVDRVEIDLQTDDFKQAKALMYAVHGEPMAEVTKKYHVYFLENSDTTVSVYQVRNDDRVFVEVEARSQRRVKEIIKMLLADQLTEYMWVQSSIFDMFVRLARMKLKPISDFLESV
jgi:adenylate cyclase class IV